MCQPSPQQSARPWAAWQQQQRVRFAAGLTPDPPPSTGKLSRLLREAVLLHHSENVNTQLPKPEEVPSRSSLPALAPSAVLTDRLPLARCSVSASFRGDNPLLPCAVAPARFKPTQTVLTATLVPVRSQGFHRSTTNTTSIGGVYR